MKVVDANFLIDYLDGVPATQTFYEANGADDEVWILPSPAYTEALVGVGNHPAGDVDQVIESLSWGEIYTIDDELSISAARIADDIGPQGPYLDGVDSLVAAVGHKLGAPVVSADGDLTHDETKQVIDVEEYRD